MLEKAVMYELNEELIRRTSKRKNWKTDLTKTFIKLSFGTEQNVRINYFVEGSGDWRFYVDYRENVLVRDLGSPCFFKRAAYGIIHSVEAELFPFISRGSSWTEYDYAQLFGMASNLACQANNARQKKVFREQCIISRQQLFRYCHELKRRWCWLLLLSAVEGMLTGIDAHAYEENVKEILQASRSDKKQRKSLRYHYRNPDPTTVQRSRAKDEYALRRGIADDFTFATLLKAEGLL